MLIMMELIKGILDIMWQTVSAAHHFSRL